MTDNLSHEEIVSELEELESRQAALNEALSRVYQTSVEMTADNIIELIEKRRLDLNDVLARIVEILGPPKPKRRARKKASGAPRVPAQVFIHPSTGLTYSKGPIPVKLKEVYEASGFQGPFKEWKALNMRPVSESEAA